MNCKIYSRERINNLPLQRPNYGKHTIQIDLKIIKDIRANTTRIIMVTINCYTMYCTLDYIEKANAMNVIQVLQKINYTIFTIKEIITDRGKEFINVLLYDYSKRMGITLLHGIQYLKRYTGKVERQMRNINDHLRKLYLSDFNPANIKMFIPIIMNKMNNKQIHYSNISPNQIVFGRNINIKFDFITEPDISLNNKDYQEYLSLMRDKYMKILNIDTEIHEKKIQDYYDSLKHSKIQYYINQPILAHKNIFGKTYHKLHNDWILGYYIVFISNKTVCIYNPNPTNNYPISCLTSIDFIKPAYSDNILYGQEHELQFNVKKFKELTFDRAKRLVSNSININKNEEQTIFPFSSSYKESPIKGYELEKLEELPDLKLDELPSNIIERKNQEITLKNIEVSDDIKTETDLETNIPPSNDTIEIPIKDSTQTLTQAIPLQFNTEDTSFQELFTNSVERTKQRFRNLV